MPSAHADLFTDAQRWHDFYLLIGGAAATLSGLMFVAVTFGAGLVTRENVDAARAFVDPPLSHFLHVILTACVFVMPTMTATVFGSLLFFGVAVRAASLVWVYRQYRRAHHQNGDLEVSDWVMGIALPAVAFAVLLLAAAGFSSASRRRSISSPGPRWVCSPSASGARGSSCCGF